MQKYSRPSSGIDFQGQCEHIDPLARNIVITIKIRAIPQKYIFNLMI